MKKLKKRKRLTIFNNYDYNGRKKLKKLEGKECLLSEQNACSSEWINTYQIIVWGPDSHQSEPHFHFIDFETMGNKVNAAYSMVTGKFLDHGSVINPLTNHQLSIAQRMITEKRWKNIQINWDMFNKNKIFKKYKKLQIPQLHN